MSPQIPMQKHWQIDSCITARVSSLPAWALQSSPEGGNAMTNRDMFWQMGWHAWPRLGFLLTGCRFTPQVHIAAGSTPDPKGHRFLFGGHSGTPWTHLQGETDHTWCKQLRIPQLLFLLLQWPERRQLRYRVTDTDLWDKQSTLDWESRYLSLETDLWVLLCYCHRIAGSPVRLCAYK